MRDFCFTRTAFRGGALLLPATLLTGLLAASPAAAQFAVYPIVINLAPAAGDTVATSVWVRNESRQAREFTFDIQDFEQDTVGTPRFLDAGTHPNSCAARLEVFPLATTLGPGQSQELRVSLAGGTGACWAALLTEAKSTGGSGITARQQIGVRINGVPPGMPLDGEITRLEVESGPARTLHVWFRNAGEAPVRPSGQVEIRNAAGDVAATLDVQAFSVLPGNTRRIAVDIGTRLQPGRYTAIPIFDFGGEFLAGGQAAFVVR
jgi:hypothetical protein